MQQGFHLFLQKYAICISFPVFNKNIMQIQNYQACQIFTLYNGEKRDGKLISMPEFGEILAELRQDQGMTQQDLADKLNVAKSSISNYETGQRRAHTELICKAAKVFGVSTDYLLGLSEFREISPDMGEKYSDGKTVGEMLKQMLALDSERRHVLCMLLSDMQLGTKEIEEK